MHWQAIHDTLYIYSKSITLYIILHSVTNDKSLAGTSLTILDAISGSQARKHLTPLWLYIKEDCYSFCIAELLSLLNVVTLKRITSDGQAWLSAVCWAGGGGRLWPVHERHLKADFSCLHHMCCMFRVKDFILHWNCSWSLVCRSIDTWGRVLL